MALGRYKLVIIQIFPGTFTAIEKEHMINNKSDRVSGSECGVYKHGERHTPGLQGDEETGVIPLCPEE